MLVLALFQKYVSFIEEQEHVVIRAHVRKLGYIFDYFLIIFR